MKNLVSRFVKDESGATAIEYGLIAAGIAIAIITAVNGVGTALSNMAALAVRRKGVKPLPEPLRTILGRLGSEDPGHRFADLAELLETLDQAGEAVPPNPEAWDRLLRYVRDHAAEDAGLRQSA